MRLIDADELKKKIRHWNYNATTSTPTFDFVTDEDIDECPTVCDIEQIRAEIEQERFNHIESRYDKGYDDAITDILAIIDRYTKGERE